MSATQPAEDHSARAAAVCRSKNVYRSEGFARVVAQRVITDRAKVGAPGEMLWPYKCPTCRRWHLTHKPQTDAPPVTIDKLFGAKP